MQREEYISRIMQSIDEVHPDSQNDICSNYSIERFLDDSILEIIKLVPKHCLTSRVDFTSSAVENLGDGTGRIKIPEGYARLTYLRMTGWHVAATDTITTSDKLYFKKTNKITGGGVAKPVVVHDGEYLYYYSLPLTTEHTIRKAEAITNIDAELSFSDMLVDCVVWLSAHKILTISGDSDAANSAKEQFLYKISIL